MRYPELIRILPMLSGDAVDAFQSSLAEEFSKALRSDLRTLETSAIRNAASKDATIEAYLMRSRADRSDKSSTDELNLSRNRKTNKNSNAIS